MNLTGMCGAQIAALDGPIGTLEDLYVDGQYWAVRYLVVGTAGQPFSARVLLPARRIAPARRATRTIWMALTREEARRSAAAAFDDAVREPWICSGRTLIGSDVAASDAACGRIRDLAIDESRWALRAMVVDIARGWSRGKPVLVPPEDVEQIDRERRVVRLRRTQAQIARLPAASAAA